MRCIGLMTLLFIGCVGIAPTATPAPPIASVAPATVVVPTPAPTPTEAPMPEMRVLAPDGRVVPSSRAGYTWRNGNRMTHADTGAPDPARANMAITLPLGTRLRLEWTPPPDAGSVRAMEWRSTADRRSVAVASDGTFVVDGPPGVRIYTVGANWPGGNVEHWIAVDAR